jgi:putative component of toxin-antitoxin plasmid stabilization module
MELILNDNSVRGQFTTYDDFTDYVTGQLGLILDLAIEQQIAVLSKQDFYSAKITPEMSLNDILLLTGDPALHILRTYIVRLAYHPPFWDDEPLSRDDVDYQYPFKAEEPNCFTEAIERRASLLSFPVKNDDVSTFECKRNDIVVLIQNVKTVESFLHTFLLDDRKNIRYVLEHYPFGLSVTLGVIGGRCYAEEALLNNDLNMSDMQNILFTLPNMIGALKNGEKNDTWDSIRDGIFEFRIHVSDSRNFRLLFYQNDGIIFLNGFIKKQPKTPPEQIKKALELRQSIMK